MESIKVKYRLWWSLKGTVSAIKLAKTSSGSGDYMEMFTELVFVTQYENDLQLLCGIWSSQI